MLESIGAIIVEKKKEGSYVSYTLDQREQFSELGYKIIHSQENELFINSAKVKHNGKIKLIYATEGYQPLSEILDKEILSTIWEAVFFLSDGILQICNNGFLGCENIELSFENIYFDSEQMKPYFIYLPIVYGDLENSKQYIEKRLEKEITYRIEKASAITVLQKEEIFTELGRTSYRVEEIHQCAYCHLDVRKRQNGMNKNDRRICLVSMEETIPLKFIISGEKFTIGRRKDNDGVVSFSKRISRLHCSIVNKNGRFGVIDEKSKFGTKINSVKCEPGIFYELHIGDVLCLPEIAFKVQR